MFQSRLEWRTGVPAEGYLRAGSDTARHKPRRTRRTRGNRASAVNVSIILICLYLVTSRELLAGDSRNSRERALTFNWIYLRSFQADPLHSLIQFYESSFIFKSSELIFFTLVWLTTKYHFLKLFTLARLTASWPNPLAQLVNVYAGHHVLRGAF